MGTSGSAFRRQGGVIRVAGAGIFEFFRTLQEAIERVLKSPDARTRLEDMQFQLAGSTSAQFEPFVEREVNRGVGVVEATGAKID